MNGQCGTSATTASSVRALLVSVSLAVLTLFSPTAAHAQAAVLAVPIVPTMNPCNSGEVVTVTGAHWLFIERLASGHLRVKDQMTGNGYGTSGDTYTYRSDSEYTFNTNGEQVEETMLFNYHVISGSKTRDFVHKDLVHLTINANGEVTATVTRFEMKCKGGGSSPTPVL